MDLKPKFNNKGYIHRQQYGVYHKERELRGKAEKGKGSQTYGDGRRLDFG